MKGSVHKSIHGSYFLNQREPPPRTHHLADHQLCGNPKESVKISKGENPTKDMFKVFGN